MLQIGVFILICCVAIRLARRIVARETILWALMSISYTLAVHIGIVFVVAGLVWG